MKIRGKPTGITVTDMVTGKTLYGYLIKNKWTHYQPNSMRLKELLKELGKEIPESDPDITGITNDSRKAGKGYIFFAIKGGHFNGNEFIDDAVGRGASAVITEEPARRDFPVPCIRVDDIYTAMAAVSDRFYGHPSEALIVAGITGTNGKTTTACLIHSILNSSNRKAGLIGTVNYQIGRRSIRPAFTTPDAVDFQRLLKEMVTAGMTDAVTEVSSHALAQRRVDCTDFYVSAFTNLTRDHLDFHGGMEKYYLAKARLFHELTRHGAVINTDNPYGRRLSEELKGKGLEIITCGLSEDAMLTASDIREHPYGLDFKIRFKGKTLKVSSPLLGVINVHNILSAFGVLDILGIDRGRALEGIRKFQGVKGRMEPLRNQKGIHVIVDYAHTPDALKKVLTSLRRFSEGRVITVFGCGGNRDRGKRPIMGEIASALSDIVIITSDNPRDEDPEDIIEEIAAGVKDNNYIKVTDRKEAIKKAVTISRKKDTILIAGKGHEDYQQVRGVKYPFSDVDVLRKALGEPEN